MLVVEDDVDLREAILETLHLHGFDCLEAAQGNQACNVLKTTSVDLVISDIQMPGLDGLALLERIKRQWPSVPVLLMTAYGAIDKAVLAIKQGAYDYLTKPFESSVMLKKIQELSTGHSNALLAGEQRLDQQGVSHQKISEDSLSNNSLTNNRLTEYGIVLKDPVSYELFELAQKVARSDSSVMITGPSGAGKEIISKFIHQTSARSKRPFVALNCAAIPENMLEAILFGYEKGAFTGAYQATAGKFEQANGGTILLDEITEMPLSLQSKLLRVLQEKEVERLGGKKILKINVRVLSTSNRDLLLEVAEKRFREDLYYRLNVFPLKVQPLRNRKKDILPLAMLFIKRYISDDFISEGQVSIETADPAEWFSETALKALQAYSWPGNIRQLENVIQRALVLSPQGPIGVKDLLLDIESQDIEEAAEEIKKIDDGTVDISDSRKLNENVKKTEFQVILNTLKQFDGNRSKTAESLGVSTRTLRYKMAKMRDMGYESLIMGF